MKASVRAICILCLASALFLGNALSSKENQYAAATETVNIKISPNTIILGSDVVWVTVHTNIPLSKVNCSTLALNDIPVAWTKADAKGNLVAKFHYAKVEEIVEPPQALLTLTGATKDGILFSGSDTVAVRETNRN
jgi:hypothetical protein